MNVGGAGWHSQCENRVQMLAEIMAYAEEHHSYINELFQLTLGHLYTTSSHYTHPTT